MSEPRGRSVESKGARSERDSADDQRALRAPTSDLDLAYPSRSRRRESDGTLPHRHFADDAQVHLRHDLYLRNPEHPEQTGDAESCQVKRCRTNRQEVVKYGMQHYPFEILALGRLVGEGGGKIEKCIRTII